MALLKGASAKARQSSELPLCALLLTTSVQVRPALETLSTVVLTPPRLSVAMKARSELQRALPRWRNGGDEMVELPVAVSRETFASTLIVTDDPASAVKLMPEALAPLIFTGWLPGLKVYPLLLGVTV